VLRSHVKYSTMTRMTAYITEELSTLAKSWMSFTPYRGVDNIVDFGLIKKLYTNILSGHKTRSKTYFEKLSVYAKSKLPSELWEYLYPDSVFRSYASWIKRGRVVKKGETSYRRDKDNTPVFEFNQTTIPERILELRERNSDRRSAPKYDFAVNYCEPEENDYYEWEQEY